MLDTIILQYARKGFAYRRWYRLARLTVERLAEQAETSPGRVSDIVAILSPRVVVSRNLRLAREYLEHGRTGADVTRSTRVALKHYEETGKIRGPKTSAFALCLRGDDNAVVIDSHILRAFGISIRDRKKYVRQRIVSMIVDAAQCLSITPSACQAAIWAGYYKTAYPTGRVPVFRVDKTPDAMVPF